MDTRVESVYASAPFKFIIDGKPLYMHSEIVSAHSKPLDRMINGHMAEAQKGFAVLEDVDFETFNRFIQWSYIGYYSPASFKMDEDLISACESDEDEGHMTRNVVIPEKTLRPSPPPPLIEDDDPDNTIWNPFKHPGGKPKKPTKHKKDVEEIHDDVIFIPDKASKDSLKTQFIGRQPTIRSESISIPPLRANKDAREDYTEVFLSHARLYVFAEMYDIQPLKTLSLENLHGTLAIFTLYSARTTDIIELLQYVYGHAGTGVDELRTLMTDYIGYEMDTLMDDEGFDKLMIEDGGTLLGDYMKMVAKRI